MDTQTTVTHFFSYNDVAIFPFKMISRFPNFVSKLAPYPGFTGSDSDVVVASVQSNALLTADTFDQLNAVDGVCVVDTAMDELSYLHGAGAKVKSKLVLAVTSLITKDLFCSIPIDSPDFDASVTFFVKTGFVSPVYDENRRLVVMSWRGKVPDSVTMNSVASIVSAVKTDRRSLTMIIPKAVASVLAKTVHLMNEAGGALSITRYTDAGEAVLGVNSDHIVEGTVSAVSVPFAVSPITFHSHPDHITSEYKFFISWPSGQDMRAVAGMFLSDNNQIAHFVVSPDGLWVMSLTYEFQLLLKVIKSFGLSTCGTELLDAIYDLYTQFDYCRGRTTCPLDRHRAGSEYLSTISEVKISTLLNRYPTLLTNCHVALKYADRALFKVELIEWSRFDDVSDKTAITVVYVPDAKGGVPVVIPPFLT